MKSPSVYKNCFSIFNLSLVPYEKMEYSLFYWNYIGNYL